METLALAGVGVLTLAAVLLALAETGLVRLSRSRARLLIAEEPPDTPFAWLLQHRREATAWVLLLALASHLGAAFLLAWWIMPRWGGAGLAIGFAVQLGVLFLLAELLPKTAARVNPEQALRWVAPFLKPLRMFTPIRRMLRAAGLFKARSGRRESVSEEDLLAVAEQAAVDSSIEVAEQEIIESVISFGNTIVRELMVPRTDMMVVDQDSLISQALDVAFFNGLTRLPVCGSGIDDIVGIVHVRDLIANLRKEGGGQAVSTAMRKAHFVPDSKRSVELFREMQSDRFHMVVVIDEYGGTAGLATLEDLLEQVFGEINDEFDVERKLVEDLGEGSYRVSGRLPLATLSELLGSELPTGRWRTAGGLVFTQLGRVPLEGECLEVNGHRLEVEQVLRRRITRILITPNAPGS